MSLGDTWTSDGIVLVLRSPQERALRRLLLFPHKWGGEAGYVDDYDTLGTTI
jgi:hypothetical protein